MLFALPCRQTYLTHLAARYTSVVAAVLSLAVPAAAQAAVSGTLVIRGGRDAHGIGMSQYGADGYALRGATFAVTS